MDKVGRLSAYPSAWARYDLAVPGTFKLLPPEGHYTELERDYDDMQVMLFGNPPGLASILDGLNNLETEINSFSRPAAGPPILG